MSKKLLVEQDIDDLHDFQKILLLNKGKLDYNDVEFIDNDGDDYPNVIEVTKDGLLFNFDDLEGFLKFFFPETYGKNADGGESEYDATYYDSMYYGNHNFGEDCYNRSSDDWDEGYVLGSLCPEALRKLYELMKIVSPNSLKYFKINGDKIQINSGEDHITEMLDTFFPRMEDDITEIDCEARQYMLSDIASDYIGEKFCNSLKPFGIENYAGKLSKCFQTYFISWGALVQMYIDNGEFDSDALDVMFKYIEKHFRDHPPVYYEIEYNLWDSEKYHEYSCKRFIKVIDYYLDDAEGKYTPEYLEGMRRLTSLGLLSKFRPIPSDQRRYIKVLSLDPETMKVKYRISKDNWGYHNSKEGLGTVDDVIAIATQKGLFDQMDFRLD